MTKKSTPTSVDAVALPPAVAARGEVGECGGKKKQHTPPQGYVEAARDWLIILARLDASAPVIPRIYMAAQALECALKGYTAWGNPTRQVKKGHDLLKYWAD